MMMSMAKPVSRVSGCLKPRSMTARKSVCVRASAAAPETDEMGFKMMRKGVKVAAKETILTPR